MKSSDDYFLKKEYARVEELGDKLTDIDPLIDWELFRPIIREMYDNRTERGGRLNKDEIVMMKMLVCNRGMDCWILSLKDKLPIVFHLENPFNVIVFDKHMHKPFFQLKNFVSKFIF